MTASKFSFFTHTTTHTTVHLRFLLFRPWNRQFALHICVAKIFFHAVETLFFLLFVDFLDLLLRFVRLMEWLEKREVSLLIILFVSDWLLGIFPFFAGNSWLGRYILGERLEIIAGPWIPASELLRIVIDIFKFSQFILSVLGSLFKYLFLKSFSSLLFFFLQLNLFFQFSLLLFLDFLDKVLHEGESTRFFSR